MRTWTNLAWPDDPYRTGQQLYRRPAPKLAAFTTWPAITGGQPVSKTTAIVYLPLHRTQPVTVTGQALTFGFRAASATHPAEIPAVADVADLDLMQARRHAAVLAGYHLADDLAALQRADGRAAWRGLAAVAGDWATRSPASGRAARFDCGLDLPGRPPLEQACQQAGISPTGAGTTWPGQWHPVMLTVERALALALLCARHRGRYQWAGTLDTRAMMTAAAWDCLPWPQTPAAGGRSTGPAPGGAEVPPVAALGQQ
jgi:hypothetical protein